MSAPDSNLAATFTAQPQADAVDPNHNPTALMAIPASELERGLAIAVRLATETTDDPSKVDDLVSEAMVGLMEASTRFTGFGKGRLTTFAYARMRGRVLDAAVREARFRAWRNRPSDRFKAHRVATTVKTSSRVDTGKIRAKIALDDLFDRAEKPPTTQEREVLDSVYRDGESLSMIAQRKGWSYGATWRRHNRALEKLRKHAEPRHWEAIG